MSQDFMKEMKKLSGEELARLLMRGSGLIPEVTIEGTAATLLGELQSMPSRDQRRVCMRLARNLLMVVSRSDRRDQDNPPPK